MGPPTLTRGRRVRIKRVQRRIPPSDWEPLKSEIDELYRDEDRKQEEVVDCLNTKRNFRVTKRQLVHQLKNWGIYKYRTTRTHEDKEVSSMTVRDGDMVSEMLSNSGPDADSLAYNPESADSLTVHLLRAVSSQASIAGPPSSFSDAGYSTLQSCIAWTAEQLETSSSMPIELTMLDGEENPDLDTWREDTELFLTLWNRGQMSRWNQLGWVAGAQPSLGISATGLLAIVSGMVLDVSVEVSDDDGGDYGDDDDEDKDLDHAAEADFFSTEGGPDESEFQNTDDDETEQEKLLDHARESALAIGGLNNEAMWECFFETMVRRNTFLSGEAGRSSCMIEALDCIRNFVTCIPAEGSGV